MSKQRLRSDGLQKGFSPIILILIILIIASGAFYLGTVVYKPSHQLVVNSGSNNPTPSATTVDEKTTGKAYTNTTYGYQIKYPADWVAKSYIALPETSKEVNADNKSMVVYLYPQNYKTEGSEPGLIGLQILENPKKLSLEMLQKELQQKSAVSIPPIFGSALSPKSFGDVRGLFEAKGSCEPNACDRFVYQLKTSVLIIQNFYTSKNFVTGEKTDGVSMPLEQEKVYQNVIASLKVLN